MIFNWENWLPGEEMRAAAVVARMLTYVIDGREAMGGAWDDDDIGIVRAHASYLAHLTAGFLPSKATEPAEPATEPSAPPEPPVDENVIQFRPREGRDGRHPVTPILPAIVISAGLNDVRFGAGEGESQ